MSMFKKSNRKSKNQRTRVEDSDEDNNSHSMDTDLNRLSNTKNNIIKIDSNDDNSNKSNNNSDKDLDDLYEHKSKTKSNPKLSFDVEEEECDVFKVKKSSYSRRLAKQTDNRKKRKDVKKEVNEENNCVNTVDANTNKTKDDLNVIWIKSQEIKENKTENKEQLKIFAGDQIESDDEYEAEEYKSNEPFHHFRGALERGVIPDAKTIYELKKQRQMARDIEELIIPLADDETYEENDSRVIREDDNDKSDDEDEDQRISFAINRDNIEREKAKEAFLMAQEEEDDQSEQESEDELDRWEREQIRKGVRMPVIQMLNQEQVSNRAISGLFSDNLSVIDMDIDRPFSRHKKSSSIPSKILNKNKPMVTIDEIIERVKNRIKTFKESIESNERQITTLSVDMNESKKQIQRLSERRKQLMNQSTDQ